jgi:hypothetical protein
VIRPALASSFAGRYNPNMYLGKDVEAESSENACSASFAAWLNRI